MSKLINMVMRIALWGISGGALAVVVVVAAQVFFMGGAMKSALNSGEAVSAAMLGAVVGGIIGFFRRN